MIQHRKTLLPHGRIERRIRACHILATLTRAGLLLPASHLTLGFLPSLGFSGVIQQRQNALSTQGRRHPAAPRGLDTITHRPQVKTDDRQPARPQLGEQVDLIVGYSDSTTVLHDHFIGLRDGVVEVVWEILGRGKLT